jgi:ribosome recycling factor
MSLLKDLEKQYRAKEISDDTYHKLKEQYKQETVETMKKLDDMTKSKI